MTTQEFIKVFSNQFEETDPSMINETTDFKNLDEWSSLVALSLIALADETYGVSLTGDDIQKAKTVKDLYERIIALGGATR